MRLALLGATGAVGETMLRVLAERRFPVDDLVLLASERSRGRRIAWGGREWEVGVPERGVFRGCDVALFSAGGDRSREWAPVAAAEGAVVVDNSSAWRMDPEVPLVVPEVNAGAMATRPKGIVGNPNCATIQLVLPLEGLRRRAGIRRVLATTFQSVSGAGQKGIDALRAELRGETAAATPFVARIAGNVIPWIGPRAADGWNEEEDKLRNEARKILSLGDVPIAATCVRVPVEVGHGVAATVELEEPLTPDEAREAMAGVAGTEVWGDERDPQPRDVAGRDIVLVGHVRRDRDVPRVLHFWVVGDNLRKGAATNAIQIAEQLIRA